ncbi:hypothetical protein P4238_02020 [Pseudomonas aeruginosa]|nr:hypothetical protein [Pseudomonas aeruginosa]
MRLYLSVLRRQAGAHAGRRRLLAVIEEHRVNSLFCAPTAIRAIRKEDPHGERVKRYDLVRCATCSWPAKLDGGTQHWLEEHTGRPVRPLVADRDRLAGDRALHRDRRPTWASSTDARCHYHVQVLDEDGRPLGANRQGAIVVPPLPLPPGCRPSGATTRATCRPTWATIPATTTPATAVISTRTASSTSWGAPTT